MTRIPDPRTWRSEHVSQARIADYKPFSFVDGEGVRCSVYVSGCLFACEGCFNEAAWSFHLGEEYSDQLEARIVNDLAHPAVKGLSLLGGEPFLNTAVALRLIHAMRESVEQPRDVWCWTGYTLEEIVEEGDDKAELLRNVDVLIDGRFDIAQRDLTLPFRGSRNQRVLDVQASLEQGSAVEWAG